MELDVILRLQTLEEKVQLLEAILQRSNQVIRLQNQRLDLHTRQIDLQQEMFSKLENYVVERFKLVDKHLEFLNTRL